VLACATANQRPYSPHVGVEHPVPELVPGRLSLAASPRTPRVVSSRRHSLVNSAHRVSSSARAARCCRDRCSSHIYLRRLALSTWQPTHELPTPRSRRHDPRLAGPPCLHSIDLDLFPPGRPAFTRTPREPARAPSPPRRLSAMETMNAEGRALKHLAQDRGPPKCPSHKTLVHAHRGRWPAGGRAGQGRGRPDEGQARTCGFGRNLALSLQECADRPRPSDVPPVEFPRASIPADQSRPQRRLQVASNYPLRGVDLQSRQPRARATCTRPMLSRTIQVGDRRLHQRRGRAREGTRGDLT